MNESLPLKLLLISFVLITVIAIAVYFSFPDSSTPAGKAIYFDAPVAVYHFDEGSGTTVNDSSGNGLHGSIIGSPEWVDTPWGKGLNFDRSGGNYVEVPDSDLFDTSSFTIELWIKPGSNTAGWIGNYYHTIVSKEAQYIFRFRDDRLQGVINPYTFEAVLHLTAGEWYHIAFTYDETTKTAKLYNGNTEIVSIILSHGPIPSVSSLRIGNHSPANNHYEFHGVIDEVIISNYAKTSFDVDIPSDETPPSTINNLSVTSCGPSGSLHECTLTWTAPGDDGSSGTASQYDVRFSSADFPPTTWEGALKANNEPSPLAAGTTQTWTITGLQYHDNYYFVMKTADEVPNWSGMSNAAMGSLASDTTPPAAITDLSIAYCSTNSCTLSWTAPGDDGSSGTASEYDVRYSTSSITSANWSSASQATGEPVPLPSGTTHTITFTGLSPSTTYYFAIKSADEVPNWSSLSNVPNGTTSGTTDTTPPSAVSNLSVSSCSNNSCSLSWTSPGDDGSTGTAAQYDVRYSTSSITSANWSSATQASGEPSPQVAGSTQSMTVSGLNPSTTYYFALKSADEVPNWSSLSNVPSKSTSSTPDTTPPTVSITSPLNNATLEDVVSIQATASDNTGVTKVEFYVADSLKSTDTSSPYSYDWNTLQYSNSSYVLKATAFDAADNNASDTITVTVDNETSPTGEPPTIDSFTATPGDGKVDLSWTVSGTQPITFNLGRRIGPVSYTWLLTNPGPISYTDNDVTNGVTYHYRLEAMNDYGTVGSELDAKPEGAECGNGELEAGEACENDSHCDIETQCDSSTKRYGERTASCSSCQCVYGSWSWSSTSYCSNCNSCGDNSCNCGETSTTCSGDCGGGADTIPPARPTGLTASSGEEKVDLDWNDNSEADLSHYIVFYGLSSGSYDWNVRVTSSNATILDLGEEVRYYFAVKAVDYTGNKSTFSDEVSAVTSAVSLKPPKNINVSFDDEKIRVNWSFAVPEPDHYDVYKNGKFVTAVTENYYLDSKFEKGETYSYYVKSIAIDGSESDKSKTVSISIPGEDPCRKDGECNPDCNRTEDLDCICVENGICETEFENTENCPSDCEEIPIDYYTNLSIGLGLVIISAVIAVIFFKKA